MTLCGVLKDIMLVCASVIIWRSAVTLIQIFGYTIALGGIVYFRLGAEGVKNMVNDGSRKWAEYGNSRPAQRKIVTFGAVLLVVFILLTAMAPTVGYDPSKAVSGAVSDSKSWWDKTLGTTAANGN